MAWRTRRTSLRWACRKGKSRSLCIVTSCWPNRRPLKTKGIESLLSWLRGRTRSRIWGLSMSHWSKRHVSLLRFRWFIRRRGWTLASLLCYQSFPGKRGAAKERRWAERQDQRSREETQRPAEHSPFSHKYQHQLGCQNRTERRFQVRTGPKGSPGGAMQRSQREPLQEEERTQEIIARVRARRKEVDWNIEQSKPSLYSETNLRRKKGKTITSDLQTGPRPQLVGREEAASWEVSEPHANQLEQEEDRNQRQQSSPRPALIRHLGRQEQDTHLFPQVLPSPSRNLGEDLPDLGPLIDDFLKENNIDLPSKAPSSVDMLSSKGSVSIKSGGSAISRSSKMSKKW